MNRAAIAKCSFRGALVAGFTNSLWMEDTITKLSGLELLSATGAGLVSEKSDRMLMLLQELAAMKESAKRTPADAVRRKRKREIKNEMKQLASQKKRDEKS